MVQFLLLSTEFPGWLVNKLVFVFFFFFGGGTWLSLWKYIGLGKVCQFGEM